MKAIQTHGGVAMASMFLNSGNNTLAHAAKNRAAARDYSVKKPCPCMSSDTPHEDAGPTGVDRDFEARGEAEQEILQKGSGHARKDHGMEEIPPDLAMKIQAAIHDE